MCSRAVAAGAASSYPPTLCGMTERWRSQFRSCKLFQNYFAVLQTLVVDGEGLSVVCVQLPCEDTIGNPSAGRGTHPLPVDSTALSPSHAALHRPSRVRSSSPTSPCAAVQSDVPLPQTATCEGDECMGETPPVKKRRYACWATPSWSFASGPLCITSMHAHTHCVCVDSQQMHGLHTLHTPTCAPAAVVVCRVLCCRSSSD